MFESEILLALRAFVRAFPKHQYCEVELRELCDGLLLGSIVSNVSGLEGCVDALCGNPSGWQDRLRNLHTLREEMEDYFERSFREGLRTGDVNFPEIARDYNAGELVKLLEVVVVVLMRAPNKEEFIEKIMNLQERCQQTFVQLIQKAMDSRVCTLREMEQGRLAHEVTRLQGENSALKDQIEAIHKSKEHLEEQLQEYEQRLLEAEAEQSKRNSLDQSLGDLNSKSEQYQHIIESLKARLITTTRETEFEISGLKE